MKYRFVHPVPGLGRSVHSHHMLPLLGIRGKLPAEGLPERMLRGLDANGQPVEIRVWVTPLVGDAPSNSAGRTVRRCTHRVRCACPGCGVELSAGRLFQHVCEKRPMTEAEAYDARVAGTLEL